jgi:hypothetical protein
MKKLYTLAILIWAALFICGAKTQRVGEPGDTLQISLAQVDTSISVGASLRIVKIDTARDGATLILQFIIASDTFNTAGINVIIDSTLFFKSPLAELSNDTVKIGSLDGFGTVGQVMRVKSGLDSLEWGTVMAIPDSPLVASVDTIRISGITTMGDPLDFLRVASGGTTMEWIPLYDSLVTIATTQTITGTKTFDGTSVKKTLTTTTGDSINTVHFETTFGSGPAEVSIPLRMEVYSDVSRVGAIEGFRMEYRAETTNQAGDFNWLMRDLDDTGLDTFMHVDRDGGRNSEVKTYWRTGNLHIDEDGHGDITISHTQGTYDNNVIIFDNTSFGADDHLMYLQLNNDDTERAYLKFQKTLANAGQGEWEFGLSSHDGLTAPEGLRDVLTLTSGYAATGSFLMSLDSAGMQVTYPSLVDFNNIQANFDIYSNDTEATDGVLQLRRYNSTADYAPAIRLYRGRGTNAAVTDPQVSDVLGRIVVYSENNGTEESGDTVFELEVTKTVDTESNAGNAAFYLGGTTAGDIFQTLAYARDAVMMHRPIEILSYESTSTPNTNAAQLFMHNDTLKIKFEDDSIKNIIFK